MTSKLDKLKSNHPFKRVNEHDWLAGVLGGFAYAFELNVFWVRLFFILFFGSFPIIGVIYLFFAAFAEKWETDPKDYEKITAD